jgi:hypothetical protein
MEQHLNATYLRPGLVERAAATAIGTVGIGASILLAAWGISLLWRYTPPEIVVRQDKPFVLAPPEPLKIDPDTPTLKVEPPPPLLDRRVERDAKTPEGDVIRREVTVFFTVKHRTGFVVTGWKYRDGSGGVPVSQFCYYSAPNIDHSSTRIDIASDGARLFDASLSLVPDWKERWLNVSGGRDENAVQHPLKPLNEV